MAGKLYGVGVGPGDPELLTLKALRLMKEADVIAVPGKEPRESVAYNIAKGAWGAIEEKELLAVPMPMTKDKNSLVTFHDRGAELVRSVLENEKNVVFLTLGDPTVYSTYLYIHKKITAMGYETEIVSGIPSFCAAAAKLNTGLVEKAELLHIIPASYQIEDALKLSGTKVLMKAGNQMEKVKHQLLRLQEQNNRTGNSTESCDTVQCMMIENCGMQEERIYRKAEEIPENAGYYSLIIVKDNWN